jgi:hypothetical protein
LPAARGHFQFRQILLRPLDFPPMTEVNPSRE